MNIKKALTLMLAAAMTLTIASCSKDETSSNNQVGSSSTSNENFQFTQPITVVVPFKSGSATDNQLRLMQADLEEALGTTIVLIGLMIISICAPFVMEYRKKHKQVT